VAYREARVGFDIGSGNKAARVDMFGPELRSLDKQSVEMRHFESRGRCRIRLPGRDPLATGRPLLWRFRPSIQQELSGLVHLRALRSF